MLRVLSQTWALMLGVLLLMLGNGLQGTLLGVRGSLEGIDSSALGYIMSAYFVGFLGGSRATPIMLKRVGHVRVFAALGSLVSAAFIVYASVVDPVAWWLLRLLVGFCFSGIYVVAESWINDSSTNDTRGQTLSLYLIVQMTGMVGGQLLLNVADPAGYELFVLITVLVSVSFAPMLLSSSPVPMFESASPMGIRELITTSPLACFGALMLGGVFSVLYAMSPVYASLIGLSVRDTSIFVMSIFAGGMVLQYPIGWLSDRLDRRLLIIGVTGVGTLAGLIGMHTDQQLLALVSLGFILGGMSNPLYSLLVAYMNDYLQPEQMASASGGFLFINGCGAMTGPILVGYAMSGLGAEWFFIFIALMLSAICLYGVYRISQRSTIDTDDQAPYVSLSTRSTSIATTLAIEAAEDAYLEAAEEEEEVFEADDMLNPLSLNGKPDIDLEEEWNE